MRASSVSASVAAGGAEGIVAGRRGARARASTLACTLGSGVARRGSRAAPRPPAARSTTARRRRGRARAPGSRPRSRDRRPGARAPARVERAVVEHATPRRRSSYPGARRELVAGPQGGDLLRARPRTRRAEGRDELGTLRVGLRLPCGTRASSARSSSRRFSRSWSSLRVLLRRRARLRHWPGARAVAASLPVESIAHGDHGTGLWRRRSRGRRARVTPRIERARARRRSPLVALEPISNGVGRADRAFRERYRLRPGSVPTASCTGPRRSGAAEPESNGRPSKSPSVRSSAKPARVQERGELARLVQAHVLAPAPFSHRPARARAPP